MPDTDPDTEFPDVPSAPPPRALALDLEIAPREAMEPIRPNLGAMGPRHSLWAALVGYFASTADMPFPALRYEGIRRMDEEDFSAEHGYEPGVEGRSEFEHGEFERWL